MDLYRDIILDHYKHPRNFGRLDGADVTAMASNATCGDHITFDLQVDRKTKKVTAVRFNGTGCAVSQAAASMLSEKIMGMPFVDINKMSLDTVTALLGTELTPSRVKCALLPVEVIQKALLSVSA